MNRSQRDALRELIAHGINHGLDDVDIVLDLDSRDIKVSRPTLIAIIRDLMMGTPKG